MLTAKAWTDLNTSTNVWGSTSYAGSYENNFTYDANGNILTQLRKNQAGTTIDNLTYNYYNSSGKLLQNRLYHVNDAVSSGSFSDDIDNMNRVKADGVTYRSPAVYTFLNTSDSVNVRNNYSYDAEGRLVRDRQEEISQISWRVDGKVAEVQRTVGSSRKRLKFDYDAMGQRIAKHQYAGNAWEKSTYYVRDAQGNVLATYNKENPGTATMKVTERDIYGSSRVGLYKKEVEMIGATTPSATAFQHETGLRQYELSNHLGNVLAVITDRKRPLDLGDYDVSGDGINDTNTPGGAADNRTDYYQAEIVMSGDYSPFGVALDGRTFSAASYRYGFNGQEKDDEVKGSGNSYDFGARLYDNRLGRFLTYDPDAKCFEAFTPYVFAANTVMIAIDNGNGPFITIQSKTVSEKIKPLIQKYKAKEIDFKTLNEEIKKIVGSVYTKPENASWLFQQYVSSGLGHPKAAPVTIPNSGGVPAYYVAYQSKGTNDDVLYVTLTEEDEKGDWTQKTYEITAPVGTYKNNPEFVYSTDPTPPEPTKDVSFFESPDVWLNQRRGNNYFSYADAPWDAVGFSGGLSIQIGNFNFTIGFSFEDNGSSNMHAKGVFSIGFSGSPMEYNAFGASIGLGLDFKTNKGDGSKYATTGSIGAKTGVLNASYYQGTDGSNGLKFGFGFNIGKTNQFQDTGKKVEPTGGASTGIR